MLSSIDLLRPGSAAFPDLQPFGGDSAQQRPAFVGADRPVSVVQEQADRYWIETDRMPLVSRARPFTTSGPPARTPSRAPRRQPRALQLAVDLGIPKDRVETIISFELAGQLGTKAQGSSDASTPEVLVEVTRLVGDGTLTIPIARTFPLEDVQDAFRLLEERHTHGKVVLLP